MSGGLVPKLITHSDGRIVTHYVREGDRRPDTEMTSSLSRPPKLSSRARRIELLRYDSGDFTISEDGIQTVLGYADSRQKANDALRRLGIDHVISESDWPHSGIAGYRDKTDDQQQSLIEDPPEELIDRLKYLSANLKGRSDQELASFITERSEELNRTRRQIPYRDMPVPPSDIGEASTHRWIDPSRIVSTPDEVWGDFGGRRQDMPIRVTAALRDCQDEGDIQHWLNRYSLQGVVDVRMYQGSDGEPVYMTGNGSHRSFLSNALGLPSMLAQVQA